MSRLLIYANANDGYIASSDATYSTARSGGGSLAVDTAAVSLFLKNGLEGATYFCNEGFLSFDTSVLGSVPADLNYQVTLTLGSYSSTTGDTIEVRASVWAAPLTTGQFVAGASLSSLTSVAVHTYGASEAAGRYNFTNDTSTTAWLNPTGNTQLQISLTKHESGITPTAAVSRSVASADTSGTTDDPILLLTSGVFVRSIGVVGTAVSGNLSLTYPTTVVSGDRFIAIITASDNIASTRTSWTLKQGTNNGSGLRTEIWYKDAKSDGTETGSLTWTRTSGLGAEGRIFAVAGALPNGDPVEAIQASANSSSSTVTFATTTSLTNAALIMAAQSIVGLGTFGLPSGTDPTFVEECDDQTDPRPVFVDSAVGAISTAGTSIPITMPAGAVAGDLAIVAINVKSSTLTATLAGWTTAQAAQGDAASPACKLYTLTHTVAGGEPGTAITFTLSGSVKAAGVMAIFRNADTSTPVNVSGGQVNASGTASVAPTITPNKANDIALYFTGPSTDQTLTTQPTGYTAPSVRFTTTAGGGSGATRCGVGFGYSLYPAQSGTGTKSGTISGAVTSAGVHIAIAAASPTSGPISQSVDDDNKTTAGAISGVTATASITAVNTGVLLAIQPSNPISVTPGVGVVTATGFAPTADVPAGNISVTTGLGSVLATGLAPTVSVSNNQNITTGLGALTATGLAPTALVNTIAATGLGAVTATGLAPTVVLGTVIATDVGSVLATGLAPTVTATANQNITTGVGALLVTGLAPTVTASNHQNITTDVGVLTVTGLEPTVSATANVAVTTGVGALTVFGFAPSVTGVIDTTVVTDTGVLTVTGLAPTVTATANQSITADTGVLTATGLAPTVSATANTTVTPGTGSVVVTGLAPTITTTDVQPEVEGPSQGRGGRYVDPFHSYPQKLTVRIVSTTGEVSSDAVMGVTIPAKPIPRVTMAVASRIGAPSSQGQFRERMGMAITSESVARGSDTTFSTTISGVEFDRLRDEWEDDAVVIGLALDLLEV